MPPKKMTPMEELVGRRLPPDAKYRDILMAGLVDDKGNASNVSEPSESWLRPAFRQMQKKGWIRLKHRISLMGGRPYGIYGPTDTGLTEALDAEERVWAAREKRHAWSRDLKVALAARKSAAAMPVKREKRKGEEDESGKKTGGYHRKS